MGDGMEEDLPNFGVGTEGQDFEEQALYEILKQTQKTPQMKVTVTPLIAETDYSLHHDGFVTRFGNKVWSFAYNGMKMNMTLVNMKGKLYEIMTPFPVQPVIDRVLSSNYKGDKELVKLVQNIERHKRPESYFAMQPVKDISKYIETPPPLCEKEEKRQNPVMIFE